MWGMWKTDNWILQSWVNKGRVKSDVMMGHTPVVMPGLVCSRDRMKWLTWALRAIESLRAQPLGRGETWPVIIKTISGWQIILCKVWDYINYKEKYCMFKCGPIVMNELRRFKLDIIHRGNLTIEFVLSVNLTKFNQLVSDWLYVYLGN